MDGLFMKIEDARGLFFRNAGANSMKRAANNTPYDGGFVGSFRQDQIGPHNHPIADVNSFTGQYTGVGTRYICLMDAIYSNSFSGPNFIGVSGGVETAPASIGEIKYIAY
jgi:hypothetical protein